MAATDADLKVLSLGWTDDEILGVLKELDLVAPPSTSGASLQAQLHAAVSILRATKGDNFASDALRIKEYPNSSREEHTAADGSIIKIEPVAVPFLYPLCFGVVMRVRAAVRRVEKRMKYNPPRSPDHLMSVYENR
jgi:hypothetical protein